MQDKNGDTVYDLEDVSKMSVKEFSTLVNLPNVIIQGTAVVRDKDGNIRKDDDTNT